jgi:hypothetical protein
LIPGLHCINEISKVNEKAGDEIGEAKWFLNNGRDGWVNLSKQILKHPDEMSEQMDFQDLVDWMRSFHIIHPIVPDEGACSVAIGEYIDWMIQLNKFPMMTKEDVIALEDMVLVSCSCSGYLHYCFCKHTFLILKKRGIFTGYPPTLDYMPVRRSRTAGRPNSARGGEALHHEG